MSNTIKQIDLLDRNSLIQIGKHLQLPGYTNNFNNPYRKKEYIKDKILNVLKEKNIETTVSKDPEMAYFKPVKKLIAIEVLRLRDVQRISTRQELLLQNQTGHM